MILTKNILFDNENIVLVVKWCFTAPGNQMIGMLQAKQTLKIWVNGPHKST